MRSHLITKTLWIITDYDRDIHPFAEMFHYPKMMDQMELRPQMEEILRHVLTGKTSKLLLKHGDGDAEISTRLRDVAVTLRKADELAHSPLLNAAGGYIMTLAALGSMGTGAWNKYVTLIEETYEQFEAQYMMLVS